METIFSKHCYIKFFVDKDFADVDCIKQTLSKAVGLAIVAGSGILKFPQIIKIITSGSVEGLSSISSYIETVMYMQVAAFAISQGIPFSVYGENLIISAQNFIIIFLIWKYNRKIELTEKFLAFIFLSMYTAVLFTKGNFGVIGPAQWKMISSSTSMLNIAARLPQIMTNFKN
mmetsp:Transcript_2715/g.4614  ORF Transcript_2715/g.4614 Transcript_2715/m.4614 type:complete len:173 (+) Transcript_2715:44-562(+)